MFCGLPLISNYKKILWEWYQQVYQIRGSGYAKGQITEEYVWIWMVCNENIPRQELYGGITSLPTAKQRGG